MQRKNDTVALVLAFLITAGLLGTGLWWLQRSGMQIQLPTPLNQLTTGNLNDRLSSGNQLLILDNASPDKIQGVQAFSQGDLPRAISQFETALAAQPNDPETRIYLNNAKATLGERQGGTVFTIAVSVPIGSNLNVAKEMLRGVAQAQMELNQQNRGFATKILLANDDNNPEIVQAIATQLVNHPEVVAVVGHNASNASLAGAPIYQAGKLVMISPTSFGKNLTDIGDHIFRTVPNVRSVANLIARYAVKTDRKTKLAVCADAQAEEPKTSRDEFIAALFDLQAQYINVPCDLSAPDFNPEVIIPKLVSSGAEGVFLAPYIDRLDRATRFARANQGRLLLYGSSTLFTFKTLQTGQADIKDLVLAVPWHPDAFPNNPFPGNARQLWGGAVNWRTAMAFDAFQAIGQALHTAPRRSGTANPPAAFRDQVRSQIQQTLAKPDFEANGAAGKIQFLPSRDRNGAAVLITVKPGSASGAGYDFVPVPAIAAPNGSP
ncbi:ABC transporter substrate-binding protein [Alkalinema sp. FACHB-956]|uniref:ABC transporter substrate-binding protein n=1 Tax=Alkalinema sp. FACHB-956 TaxID=2692768 RepID=UPI0016884841|nr:ABC transporter substrate-binding protein [Alkalinema sp. FACHB-956]MBD2327656.1 amino acid ABC transporter substrate-binding protein [Alkalinema sp. FACHB-956]